MAAELTEFFQQQNENYLELKDTVQGTFTQISDEFKEALQAYDLLLINGATLDKTIAGIRTEMSVVTKQPSDIEVLAEELRQLLIDRHHYTATLADAQENLDILETRLSQEEDNLAGLIKSITLIAADLTAAQQRQTNQEIWLSSDTEDAITEVRDKATALLAGGAIIVEPGEVNPGEVFADATSRIESDFPELILTHARTRAGLVDSREGVLVSHRDNLNASLLAHSATQNGASGELAQRWAEYTSVEDNLKNYALTSISQYEHALSLLTSVVDSKELTLVESERIVELAVAVDPASEADADTEEPEGEDGAISTEEALQVARAAVDAKQLELELAIIAALTDDVNADLDSIAEVQDQQDQLIVLEAELAAAEASHTDEFATALDLLEVAIPDAIWANLYGYDFAISNLTAIRDSNVSTLDEALTLAETELVSALGNSDNSNKLSNILAAAAATATAHSEYLTRTQGSRSLSAMRGD